MEQTEVYSFCLTLETLRANMTPLVFRVFGRSKREVVIGKWKYAWQVHIYIALMAQEWHMHISSNRTYLESYNMDIPRAYTIA